MAFWLALSVACGLTLGACAQTRGYQPLGNPQANPRAIALYGNRGWGTKQEAQPVLIVKDGTAFAAADAIAG